MSVNIFNIQLFWFIVFNYSIMFWYVDTAIMDKQMTLEQEELNKVDDWLLWWRIALDINDTVDSDSES